VDTTAAIFPSAQMCPAVWVRHGRCNYLYSRALHVTHLSYDLWSAVWLFRWQGWLQYSDFNRFVNDERGCQLLKCACWKKLCDCVGVTWIGTFGRPWV